MKLLKRWLAFFVVVVLVIGVAFNSRGPLRASHIGEENTTTNDTGEPDAQTAEEGQQQTDGTAGENTDAEEPAPDTEANTEQPDVPTEQPEEKPAEPEVHQDAMELSQVMTGENGEAVCNVTADIPEGTFEANTSDVTMEVTYAAADASEQIKGLMNKAIAEGNVLGEYFLYNVIFKVNGEQAEPGKEIKITFEQYNFQIKDTKKATTFYYNEANSAAGNAEAEIVKITQKSDKIEELQNAGQSTDNIDDYDLSEISLREDGSADKIMMEGRRSTIYGCYLEEQKPVEVTDDKKDEKKTEEKTNKAESFKYEDDEVSIIVTAEKEGIIPANSKLQVVPIKKDEKDTKDQYKDVENKLQEKAEKEEYEIAGFLAYDISFVDADGNKVEPNGEVKVVIDYKKAALPEEVDEEKAKDAEVTVLHLEEDEKGEVKDVVDMGQEEKIENVETTDNKEVEKTEFKTESFSTFTITWTVSRKDKVANIHLIDTSGKSIDVIPEPKDISNLKNEENIDLDVLGKKYAPDNMAYKEARLDSKDGTVAKKISYNVKNGYVWWYYENNSWHKWKQKGDSVNVYLVYTEKLSTVDTVKHSDKGITMRMIDYETAADGLDNALGGAYNDEGSVTQGLIKPTLTNGYPVIQNKNRSLAKLFSGGTTVDNLFIKDTYESTGYFEYSSFENYAYLDGDSFTVYKQLGTPVDTTDTKQFFYLRGNFMPYNKIIDGTFSKGKNLYDENGYPLDTSNPRYNEPLYITQGANYHFGMYMETDFLQPKDGLATYDHNKEDMIFEFNGDDDLWIFIDDVLVLDIGGKHDAHSGYINFYTVEVCVNTSKTSTSTTNIKEMFKNAGVFPDGTNWNDKNADEYFRGNTFIDYTTHNMKMFYMERGAGASNLHMKFNLQTIPEGTVQVKKELSNTDKEKYANVEFAFQVYAQEITGVENGIESYSKNYVLLDTATDKNGDQIEFKDGVNINNQSYDNVFYLKPGEIANFEGLQSNREYYVVEIGVKSEEYDKITINGTEYTFEGETEAIRDIKTDPASVENRPVVVCTNNCSAYNIRELRITKEMAEGQTTEDTFTFNVKLENQSGKLEDYSGGYYLLKDSKYYYYDGSELKSSGTEQRFCGTTKNGNISGVPVGYTVAITNILSGTSFLVTEVNLSDEYENPSKEIKELTYGESDIEGADGELLLGKTEAEVTITNTLKQKVKVIKEWGNGTEKPTDAKVYVGLYKDTEPTGYAILDSSNQFMHLFDKLGKGQYTVKELRPAVQDETYDFTIDNIKYTGVENGESVVINDETYMVNYSDIIQDEDDQTLSNVTITNTIFWDMFKRSTSTDSNGDHPFLEGAQFTISNNFISEDLILYYGKSGSDGKIRWYKNPDYTSEVFLNTLPNGKYEMLETKAPNGYVKSGSEWSVTIVGGYPNQILHGGKEVDIIDNAVYLDNSPIYDLPSAGGPGTFWYTVGGTLLMCLAGMLALYKNKRKRGAELLK